MTGDVGLPLVVLGFFAVVVLGFFEGDGDDGGTAPLFAEDAEPCLVVLAFLEEDDCCEGGGGGWFLEIA